MFVGSRLRTMLLLLTLVVGALPSAGCRKKAAEANKAQVALNGDSAKQSLAALKPKLDALTAKFADLHKQIDPLPPDLPGFGEVRAKFYNTDIGMGVMGPKLTWLSERLDAALKSGNSDELKQVTADITRTHDELAQIDRIALEVLHQALPFQRMAKLRTNAEGSGAATPPASSSGATASKP